MLTVIMPSVVMLNVANNPFMLSVVMLNAEFRGAHTDAGLMMILIHEVLVIPNVPINTKLYVICS